jgi:cyclopropane fatty-acyl-phospholipid synthase-like methyltransferase
MKHDDEKRLVDFYEKAFAEHGNDARSVQWADEKNQIIRFAILEKIAPLEGKSVLDVGCGLGDLYKFFAARGIGVEYSGMDIVPAFVDRARERFPGAEFMCGDVETLNKEYDYILASGVLSFAMQGGKEYYFEMIKRLFSQAREGFAFNMLNESAHPSDDTYLAYNTEEVTAYCKTLSPRVIVMTGYLPWDFTVYMYKK